MVENNIINHVISLQSFTVFSEYFIALSIIYILIVITLIAYNSYQLMLQKAVSNSISLILFMSCYLMLNDDLVAQGCFVFDKSLINDYLGFFTKFLICFCSAIYFLFIADFLKEQKLTSFEYLIIILFAVLGLMLMCCSNDLLIAYLTIELSSLAFYILASFKKTSSYSIEGGIKYFITGAVSSAFFLLGSSFLYGITGSINFYEFFTLFRKSQFDLFPFRDVFYFWPTLSFETIIWYLDQEQKGLPPIMFDFNFVEIGLGFILFSLFIKLALAPFHLWSLDVYEGSPTSATFFFAVISKLSIFVLLIRICYISFLNTNDNWKFYFIWVGVFSIFVGSFGGLKQRKLKSLLAYSSTSHMGYLLLALSVGNYLGIEMVLFYMVIYMISGLCLWYIVLVLKLKTKNPTLKYNKELGDLAILHKSNKSVSFLLALTMFSIAGIPPLVGFLAKLNVFLPLICLSLNLVALVSILFSVISTFYYIRVIKVLYFENLLVGKLYFPINSEKTIILSILVLLLIFLFINPNLLYLLCYKTTLLLPCVVKKCLLLQTGT